MRGSFVHRLSENPTWARWGGWVIPALVLGLWEISSRFGVISQLLLPSPSKVVETGVRLLSSGDLAVHVAVSLRRAAFGFLIGGSVGFAFGFLNGLFRFAEILFDAPIQMLRTIPHLALLPIVILWFGIGEESKLFLVSLGSVFPLYINTFYGVRSVDPGLLELAQVYRLGRRRIITEILLPGALPSILVGVRYALGVTWLTLIVAETIASNAGIGFLAMNAREVLALDVVALCIVIYAFLGKVSDSVARSLEARWTHWHSSQNRRVIGARENRL